MENVNRIKLLQQSAAEIESLFLQKIPKWQADPKHFDKVRFGFCAGGSDGWYKSQEVLIHFEAWVGTYGDSSTYQAFEIDGEVFKNHFLSYLNVHKKEIMMAIATSIRNEADRHAAEAKRELETQLQLINSLAVS